MDKCAITVLSPLSPFVPMSINHHHIWQQAVAQLEDSLESPFFSTWVKSIHLLEIHNDEFVLEVPNRFIFEWVKENYLDILKEKLSTLGEKDFNISLKISPQNQETSQEPLKNNEENNTLSELDSTPEAPPDPPSLTTGSSNLNPKYTFKDFVSGSTNQFAYAAAMAVANNPGTTYNPLFIYGGVGLGKTHLVNAIGNLILKNRPDIKICYYSSEKFINELINSLRYAKMENFRKRFRSVDVLLIDDIQFIAGKERTQEEFFHTFNDLYESQKQIVVTSDKFPKDMAGLEERLRSRFEWGLIADIQPLDVETKQAILKLKAEKIGIKLPEEVSLFLANSATTNVRDLEGYLNRLSLFSLLNSTPLSLEMAQEILKDILHKKSQEIPIEEIQKAVAVHYNLKISDLKSQKRLKALIIPRQVAMYLARSLTSCSYPEIGLKFGGKDHSTIIHAIKKIEKNLEDDYRLRSTIEEIKKNLPI